MHLFRYRLFTRLFLPEFEQDTCRLTGHANRVVFIRILPRWCLRWLALRVLVSRCGIRLRGAGLLVLGL